MKQPLAPLLALLLFPAAPALTADDAAAILARVDRARNPIASFAVDVQLTSISADGSDTSRYRVFGKGSDRSVVEFTYPQSEKGKSLLMLRDAMWIYMPSASRPIRISPLQRLSGQASNGDVARTAFTVDYDAKSMSEEEGLWVLDLVAKDPAVAYARIRLWVDKKSDEPQRADFYVVSGKLIKRAFYREYGLMNGRRGVIRIEIDDLLKPGNRTVMQYANLVAHDNPDKLFTKDGLGKW